MQDRPLVSIGMPVYNPDSFLRASVLSLINQDLKSWELLIIDDGSQNDIDKWIGDFQDPRIIIIKGDVNLGLAKRLNECIDLAQGIYFARMDADDISYLSRLSKQLAFLEKHPDIDLVATRALAIDDKDRVIGALPYELGHDALLSKPWRGICMPHPTWMGRIEWFKKYKYQIPSSYLSEDQELLLRASRESRYTTIDEILFAYRIRSYVDSRKLSKTRLAILNFQVQYFLMHKEHSKILMSLAAYILKKFADIFLSRGGGLGHLRYAQASDLELNQWLLCRKQLSSLSGVLP